MEQIECPLHKGILVGQTKHTLAILRSPTAQEIIDAMIASEKIVMVPEGFSEGGDMVLVPKLVPSPTATGIAVLKKQIVSIGTVQGPIDDIYWNFLSPEDLNRLQVAAKKLETAAIEVAERGRTDQSGDSHTPDD